MDFWRITPMNGEREIKSRFGAVAVVKRLACLAFTVAGLMFALDQFGVFDALGQRAPRRVAQPAEELSAIASDCDYLQAPDNFRGVQARHRREVSQLTESLAARLTQEGMQLVPPQQMPRKNIIDDLIFGKMATAGIQSAPLSTDEEFIRRAYLDLTGRIPSADDVVNFLKDQNPIKRDVLLENLVNSQEAIDKWTMFFGDLYKNTSQATNINRLIGGREAFYKFIRESLEQNKNYAQMATEIITARGDSYENGPVNFIVGGNVPMGPAQDTYDGLAVQTATVFLGLSSMDCLLCHDGAGHLDAVNLWGSKVTRADAWGLSAFFARTRRTQQTITGTNLTKYTIAEAASGEYDLNTNSGNRQNRTPIGSQRNVPPKYFFTGGGITAGEDRRTALARYITADPQFARATVNYLWEELMVEAFVSPSNTFDPARLSSSAKMPEGWAPQPSNPDLLEALAQEFISSGYNLRHIIKMIALSNTYQLSSKYPGTWKLEYVPYYARKYARRLDAEEIHDAIVKATNLPPVTNAVTINTIVTPRMLGFPVINEMGQKLREAQWAMQLSDPIEPRQGQANGSSAAFLNSFLRGNRDSNPRLGDSSILQALNLMNNDFIRQRVEYVANINTSTTNTRGYIDPIAGYNTERIPSTVKKMLETPGLTNEQIITQLYLTTLSRYPTQREIGKVLPYFTPTGTQTAAAAKQSAVESLQWVLLNKADFIFNY
jgi:hypothetical protein